MRLPGRRLRTFATRFCDTRTMARLVDPVLADLQAEYHEAAASGRIWQCRLAWLRAMMSLARVAVLQGAVLVVRSLRYPLPDERRPVSRTLIVIAASMLVFVTVLSAPVVVQFAPWHNRSNWRLVGLIIPKTIPLALPASLVCGIVFGLAVGWRRRLRARIVVLAVAASCASWCLLAWAVPASNQAFRGAISEALGLPIPSMGVNELTLGEIGVLLSEPAPRSAPQPFNIRTLAYAYHARWALACAPLVLSALALSLTGTFRNRRWIGAAAGVSVLLGYFTSLSWARMSYESAIAAAWVPNFICLVLTAGLMLLQRQRDSGNSTATQY